MATRTVTDGAGRVWQVRRRWVPRRLRWRGNTRLTLGAIDGSDLIGMGADLPVVGIVLAILALLLLTVGLVIFIVPAVVFVLELLLVVVLVGVGTAVRILFGRPWTIEAVAVDDDTTHEWTVKGWRASGRVVAWVVQHVQETGELPATSSPSP